MGRSEAPLRPPNIVLTTLMCMSKLQKHERQFHKNPAHAPPVGLAPEPHRLSESLTRNTDTGTIKRMVWQGHAYFIV